MSRDALIFFCHIIFAVAAGAEMNCSEPEPVGNAYRSWDGGVPNGYVNYTCLGPYYVLTAGNLSRWCDKDNFTNYVYTGSPPVCTLKCEGEPKQESMSNITSKNGTSLGVATYTCIPPSYGTDNPNVTCSDKAGGWTNSLLDCADTVSKPENLIDSKDIQSTNSTSSGCDNGSSTEPVTRIVVKTWVANITTTQERVEVVSVNITLKVNQQRPFVPCRTTSHGLEYSGTLNETQGKYRCKRWDSLEYNYTHGSSFPADSSVTAAENYCRQPIATFVDLNSTHKQPWCFTTSSNVRTDYCNVEACGQINVAVMDQEWKQICSSVNVLDMLQVSSIFINCTRVEGERFPFGQRLKISFNLTCSDQETVSLDIYNVSVRGREYIGGCGQAKTFWGLNLISSNASIATYQCHEGWHYRGGDLTATCNAFREWVGPDPSLCTDEPNRAEGALVNYITNGFQSSASLTIDASGMQGNCVTFDTMTNELNVKLKQPIEISEVVVTTVRDIIYTEEFTIQVETYLEPNGPRKSCLRIRSWTNGTGNSACSLQPVTRNIRIWSSAPPVSVKICNVKVFGRPFKTPFPLECFQTPKGNDYKGKINMTTSGKTCQYWASHGYTDVSVFPDESQNSLGNNCRNPSNETHHQPWCFTSNSSGEWEYCPIFSCDDICRLREDGVNYRGKIDTTSSGRTCLNWFLREDTAKQFPFLQNSYFSDFQAPGNKCRNPIASQSRPWCYINQTSREYEFCDIPECPHAGEMSSLWLDPNNYTSLPSWLFTKNSRECFFWYNTDMSQFGRSVAINNASLWNLCGYGSGALCDFVDNNTTEWIYFRFNCSFDPTTSTTPKQSLFTKVKDSACRCVKIAVNAREELNASVARIRHELIVNTKLLSAAKRKKVSAKDSRPSAIASGVLGIAILVTALTLLVSHDVINAIRFLIRWFHAYISHVKSKNLK